MNQLRHLVILIIMPWRLSKAMDNMTALAAVVAMVATIVLYGTLFFLGFSLGMSEPYGDVETWTSQVARLLHDVKWRAVTVLVTGVTILFIFAAAAVAGAAFQKFPLLRASAFRVVVLWPVSLFIPFMIGLLSLLVMDLPSRWQDGTPFVPLHRLGTPIGACAVPLIGCVASTLPLTAALAELARRRPRIKPTVCPKCRYSLDGLPRGVCCPECGASLDYDVES